MHEQSSEERELRSLRARAYGPNADIHDDPVAMERLRLLEAQSPRDFASSPPSTPGPAAWPDEWDEDEPAPAPEEAPPPADHEASTPTPVPEAALQAPPPAPAPRRPRRGALLWAGALVLALIVGAAITYTTFQVRMGQVGVLAEDPDAPWPDTLGARSEGGMVFEQFHGLNVLLAPQFWSSAEPSLCLFVLPAETDGSLLGIGCGAGEFDPTAAIIVTADLPDELLERFEVGSALQFVLHDGEVVVYSDGS
ncbi:hypothetical protein ABZ477_16005 [Microbacterium sp. NPDC019599]|uniref:hypothetical protein n=1 Tax=Microbacterium sp. NPDC019599 TaxID=3154690 RepID=UPI0033D03A4C